MRIAVAGGTGTVGNPLAEELRRRGHQSLVIAHSTGCDLRTVQGPATLLDGVETVVDVTNAPAATAADAQDFFGTVARNLLTAAHQVGVAHYVLLSIVGVDRASGNPHFAGNAAGGARSR